MEGWTNLSEDDVTNAKGKINFSFEDFSFDPCKERLRSSFDQVLVTFMREKSSSRCIRPVPAYCGDGREVDLFKLFWIVWKIGGYDAVSRNNLWGFVSKELGCGVFFSSLKLIYVKYLKELDEWLRRVFIEDRDNGIIEKLDLLAKELEIKFRVADDNDEKLCIIKNDDEFEKLYGRVVEKSICEIRGDIYTNVKDDGGKFCVEDGFDASAGGVFVKPFNEVNEFSKGQISDKTGKYCVEDTYRIVSSANGVFEMPVNEVNGFSNGYIADKSGKSRVEDNNSIVSSSKKVIEKAVNKAHRFPIQENTRVLKSSKKVEKVIGKSREFSGKIIDDEENTQKDIDFIGNVLDSRKRKREFESPLEMLNWLKNVAKRSDDPSIGLIPEFFKWKDYVNDEFWAQTSLVKNALLVTRGVDESERGQFLQNHHKKPRTQPSTDDLNHQSVEKLRCNQRIPSPAKPFLCSCCNSGPAPQGKVISHKKSKIGNSPKAPLKPSSHKKSEINDSPKSLVKPLVTNLEESADVASEKHVFVGPLFQAEVPKWTNQISPSDPKWLGTRMWTPQDSGKKTTIESHSICNCPFQDSVECVRFHIAEQRFKLKCEIGNSLFHHWGFDRMGEEVSLSWTKEEEEKFKNMITSYGGLSTEFRNDAYRVLPSKKRVELVSYYFNVFLVQRRSYQNRVTPKDIDSDDDEKECGLIGDSFGYKAINVPGSRVLACTQNMEGDELV